MNQWAIAIPTVLLVGLALVSVPPVRASPIPNGILHYVPVTVMNSQNTSTPSPFQLMVSVASANYAPYEATNLQNVEFFNSDGSPVPSWLESGNSNTASNTTYWLNLGSGIPAHSSLTIYMGFGPLSMNFLNAQNTGEAPQLSAIYGEYDNGQLVFNYYQHWGGLKLLPVGWANFNEQEAFESNRTVFEMGSLGFNAPTYAYQTLPNDSGLLSNSGVLEFYGKMYKSGHETNYKTFVGIGNQLPAPDQLGIGSGSSDGNTNTQPNYFAITTVSTGFSQQEKVDTQRTIANHAYLFGVAYTGIWGGTVRSLGYLNYSLALSYQAQEAQPKYIVMSQMPGTGGSQEDTDIYWVRERAYPPNGVMPSAVFGAILSMTNSTTNSVTSATSISSTVTLTTTFGGATAGYSLSTLSAAQNESSGLLDQTTALMVASAMIVVSVFISLWIRKR